eukprot:CAMPEP_0168493926 /NCGR_PEP_ID=MMETSP0228-20121227/70969_1 /TAXON_ID=133427 /ORGANISM="Protoceratium reticulatum, Strain CCCM 535 (=CCMP 1889)" /LENGTH=172 /DNA_ID=CAMNT_0008510721 /DNA_START=45 /DNA_END=564 /DNA_ORIENTATION=+
MSLSASRALVLASSNRLTCSAISSFACSSSPNACAIARSGPAHGPRNAVASPLRASRAWPPPPPPGWRGCRPGAGAAAARTPLCPGLAHLAVIVNLQLLALLLGFEPEADVVEVVLHPRADAGTPPYFVLAPIDLVDEGLAQHPVLLILPLDQQHKLADLELFICNLLSLAL